MESQHEFVTEPDSNLKCLICKDVAENPQQETNCGKLFCTSCLDKVQDKKCPHCRHRHPSYFNDRRSDTEIKDLIVKCHNSKHGCSWTGQLRYVQNHMTKSCDYVMKKCKHADIGCKEKCIRKRIREHEEDDIAHLPLLLGAVKKMREDKNSASDNGKIIKMTDYKELKRQNKSFESEPFFSHPNGYRLQLIVWPNGCSRGKNEYLSVVVKLLEGPHDRTLSWPFVGDATIILLNQKTDYSHHDEDNIQLSHKSDQITRGSRKNIFYDPKYISHDRLEYSFDRYFEDSDSDSDASDRDDVRYLIDDSLYFRVLVETPQYKHWLQ